MPHLEKSTGFSDIKLNYDLSVSATKRNAETWSWNIRELDDRKNAAYSTGPCFFFD